MRIANFIGGLAAGLTILLGAGKVRAATQNPDYRTSNYELGPVSRIVVTGTKRGTVIDQLSGVGIADATVIAAWEVSSHAMEHDSTDCALGVITHTDVSGQFELPDVSKDDVFHPQHYVPKTPAEAASALFVGGMGLTHYSWQLAVFKPGYVREGDQEEFRRVPLEEVGFMWASYPPKVSATFKGWQVKPIKMMHKGLSVAEELVFLERIERFAKACPSPSEPASVYEQLRQQINGIVWSLPCSLPETTPIPKAAVWAFSRLHGGGDSLNDPFFGAYVHYKTFDELGQRDTFVKRMKEAATRNGNDWKDTTAGVLCWAQGRRVSKP